MKINEKCIYCNRKIRAGSVTCASTTSKGHAHMSCHIAKLKRRKEQIWCLDVGKAIGLKQGYAKAIDDVRNKITIKQDKAYTAWLEAKKAGNRLSTMKANRDIGVFEELKQEIARLAKEKT